MKKLNRKNTINHRKYNRLKTEAMHAGQNSNLIGLSLESSCEQLQIMKCCEHGRCELTSASSSTLLAMAPPHVLAWALLSVGNHPNLELLEEESICE